MRVRILDRVVYSFYDGAEELLDSITCNDLDKPVNAFLDKFGRLIVLFDQFVVEPGEIQISFQRKYEKNFLDHVNKYLPFVKTKMKKLQKKEVLVEEKGSISIKQVDLDHDVGVQMSDDEFNECRVENNKAIQGIDFDKEMFLSLCIPNSISTTKGCYLGQEIIARMLSRGKAPKKLVRIESDDEISAVLQNGKSVAVATSQAFSESRKKFIAFALVPNTDELFDNVKLLVL